MIDRWLAKEVRGGDRDIDDGDGNVLVCGENGIDMVSRMCKTVIWGSINI